MSSLSLKVEGGIVDCVETIMNNSSNGEAGGLAVNWMIYGSSNHIKKPAGLVIENYLWRAKDNYSENNTIKTIANPRLIVQCDIHSPQYITDFKNINENGEIVTGDFSMNSHKKIRINHYASKSREESQERVKKGFGGTRTKHLSHDINDIYDDIMLKYVDEVKSKINV